MTKQRLLAAAALSVLNLTAAAWAQQSLVNDQSEIRFTFKQLGVPVTGHFKLFDGEIQLRPQDLANSHVRLQVDTGSASIGDPQTDAELAKPDWFDTTQFPTARFESSSIQSLGDNRYEARGTLQIKGTRSEITVPVTLEQAGEHTVATGSLPLQRLDYQVGAGAWGDPSVVANDVQVQFKITIAGV